MLSAKPLSEQRRPFQDRRDDAGLAGAPGPAPRRCRPRRASAASSATPCQTLKRHGSRRADAERLEHGKIGAVRDHAGEYPGMRQRPLPAAHHPDQHADQRHVGDQQHVHHLGHVRLVRPDLVRHVEHFRHRDRVGNGRGLDQVDQIVVERRQADAERERQDHVDVGLQPRVAEAFGGFERLARHRLDAGAEDLDVERARVERQADRRPGEVRHDRHRHAGAGGDLQVRAEREIEEIELHQRRRVAEELDVALRDEAQRRAGASPGSRRRPRRSTTLATRHTAIRRTEVRKPLKKRARSNAS